MQLKKLISDSVHFDEWAFRYNSQGTDLLYSPVFVNQSGAKSLSISHFGCPLFQKSKWHPQLRTRPPPFVHAAREMRENGIKIHRAVSILL